MAVSSWITSTTGGRDEEDRAGRARGSLRGDARGRGQGATVGRQAGTLGDDGRRRKQRAPAHSSRDAGKNDARTARQDGGGVQTTAGGRAENAHHAEVHDQGGPDQDEFHG